MSHRLPSVLSLVAGLWLILSPFILGYSWNPWITWTEIIVGALVAVLSIGRAFGHLGDWAAWTNMVLGVWLLFSPYMFGFWGLNVAFNWNDVIMGGVVVLLAIWDAFAQPMNEWGGVASFAATHPTEDELRRRDEQSRRP